jgi:anti-sigma B factor antagonist
MLAAEPGWDAPVEFHVAVDVTADPPVVAVWGEVDLATVAAVRDALGEALETGADEIVVDLGQVTFMGSTGIRELIRIHDAVRRIELRVPPGIVRRALETAVLPDTFVIVG